MPRARKAHLRKAPNEQQDYPAWKAEAAKMLKARHDLEPMAIAERIWTQFYVRRLTPKEAADRAEMICQRTRAPTPWLEKKRKEKK